MSDIVLFGAGKIADEAFYYINNDSEHRIAAFTVDSAHLTGQDKLGLPVVAFENIVALYPPDRYKMFIAVGYQDMNRFRARKYSEAKAKGYELISYVSSRASNIGRVEVGDNCFILDNAVIQPCSRIGSNVFIWSGNHVGHHAHIDDHCYLSGQVVLSGSSKIEPYCFLGVNSTIGHEITIGAGSFIGAATLITRNVAPNSVYIKADTPKFRLDTEHFLQMTKML